MGDGMIRLEAEELYQVKRGCDLLDNDNYCYSTTHRYLAEIGLQILRCCIVIIEQNKEIRNCLRLRQK
jgi:hypothetical protein